MKGVPICLASLYSSSCLSETANDDVVLSDDELAGYQIIINAIKYPLKAICENAGKSGDIGLTGPIEGNDKIVYVGSLFAQGGRAGLCG